MKIYPKLVKHVLFPFYESVVRGRPTMKHINNYENNLKKTKAELEEIQFNRLLGLLTFAEQNVPYYQRLFKEQGISIIDDIKNLDDFKRIPVLTKEIIREFKDDLIPTNLPRPNLTKSTGGSTGESLHLELNHESEMSRQAVKHRGYGWLGAGLGERIFMLWGASFIPANPLIKFKAKLHDSLLNTKTVSSFNMKKGNMHEYIAEINAYKPSAIVSYTDPIYQLAKYVNENGIKVHKPKSVLTAAEALHEYQRDEIEKAFGCAAYSTYGCRETMLIGAECENKNGYHTNIDHLVIETLDENLETISGEEGDVTLTDLSNYGMPLIRYQNGDRAILGGSCECSNPLPIMQKVTGRKVEVIKTPSGAIIPGTFFPALIKDVGPINKYQVKQTKLSEVDLFVVENGELKESDLEFMQLHWGKLKSGAELNIHIVEHIEVNKSGKHRVIICEV